jgi:uncharacterized protein (DUF2141 family)
MVFGPGLNWPHHREGLAAGKASHHRIRGIFGAVAGLLLMAPAVVPAQPAPPESCDGTPTDTRLYVIVEGLHSDQGLMAYTLYGDDRSKFLAHHGSMGVLRVKATMPTTKACLSLPKAGYYAVAVYHDLNADHSFNRKGLFPGEPYGLSNNAPTLFGLPSFDSVRFFAHPGDNTIHIRLKYP